MGISHAEFLEMQARCERGRKSKEKTEPANGVSKESDLHNQIIAYCKSRGWIYFHGSMAHASRRTVGEPDFIILADSGRAYFVECKTKTGKLSPEQLGMILWAGNLGHKIHVVRSMEEFLDMKM